MNKTELTRDELAVVIGERILDNLLEYWNDHCRNKNEDWEYHHSEDSIRNGFAKVFEDTAGWRNFALNKLAKDDFFLSHVDELAKDIAENEELGW